MRTVGLSAVLLAGAATGGCGNALDQDRPMPPSPATTRPTTGPIVATGQLGVEQPLPGLRPTPKPFVDLKPFRPNVLPSGGQPSTLLQTHALPDTPVSLSLYGSQPTYRESDFPLGPTLTGAAVRRRLGPPAGMAVVGDPWSVYKLPFGGEMWLHFEDDGVGTLLAADVVRPREDGYSRERRYPTR